MKQQEDVSSPIHKSDYIAMTHSSKEASRPCSPVSATSSDPKAPVNLFSDNHAAIAFMRNHQYHPPDPSNPLGHEEVKLPSSCTVDHTVANRPTPLLSAKEKHFATSPGLRMK